MAHVHTFGTVAPAAAGIIQLSFPSLLYAQASNASPSFSLGATSCYVTESVHQTFISHHTNTSLQQRRLDFPT